jgi:TIR domain
VKTPATATVPERNMLFLSHATPEDNDFARWLALQLASEGYPIWCDLTKLLGGEDFWKDIQEAIRTRSIRFLFVLSRSSNAKDGTLQELACAKAVAAKLRPQIRDYIIALKIDDLPYSDVDIEISAPKPYLLQYLLGRWPHPAP